MNSCQCCHERDDRSPKVEEVFGTSNSSWESSHEHVYTITYAEITVKLNKYGGLKKSATSISSSYFGTHQDINFVIVDSGAGFSIFSTQDGIFESVNPRANVCLRGVSGAVLGGTPIARFGELKPNNLLLNRAILFTGLPVLGLIAVKDLNEAGWDVLFLTDRSEIYHPQNEVRIVMGKDKEGLKLLPFVVNSSGCIPVYSAAAVGGNSRATRYIIHVRSGHLLCPQGFTRKDCPECLVGLGRRNSHGKERDLKYILGLGPLALQALDYWGPVRPTSIRGRTIILVVISDKCKLVYIVPLANKGEVAREVRDYVLDLRRRLGGAFGGSAGLRLVFMVRMDNEPVLRGKVLADELQKLQITPAHTVPYK